MQVTLQIDRELLQVAQSEAARLGMTLEDFVTDAIKRRCITTCPASAAEVEERNRLMDELLKATAHFRIGERPTRSDALRETGL
jgi:hypothetical protein